MKTLYITMSLILSLSLVSRPQNKKIIFVCEHGAAKSVIASTYFNKLAKERNLEWESVCRGTNPDAAVSPGTMNGLSADQVKPNVVPKKLSYPDTTNAEMIILFTPLPKDFDTDLVTEDWSSTPHVDDAYPERRDAILQRLDALLRFLGKLQQKHWREEIIFKTQYF